MVVPGSSFVVRPPNVMTIAGLSSDDADGRRGTLFSVDRVHFLYCKEWELEAGRGCSVVLFGSGGVEGNSKKDAGIRVSAER